MEFKRNMNYLLIAVIFGLAPVISTYNLLQCGVTVQRNKTSFVDLEISKWLKWGRVFHFCRYLNSTYDYGCLTRDCKECLTICRMDKEIRDVMSLCKQNCSSHACKLGCRFYSEGFTNSSDTYTMIKKPKLSLALSQTQNLSKILNENELYLSWRSVNSHDTFRIPSLYLVIMTTIYGENVFHQLLSLTEASQYFVQIKDMCIAGSSLNRDVLLRETRNHHPLWIFRVIPINFVGPTSKKDLSLNLFGEVMIPSEARPSVKNVSVSKPFLEHSVKDNFDYIVWEIEWEGMSNITDGFQIEYGISTCSGYTIEMKRLNPKRIHFVKEVPFRMRIANTKDDKLDTCSIPIKLWNTKVECFFRNPYKTIIKYGGCTTIPGYPCPKDTLIYDFCATISATDCVNPFPNACQQNKNITCQYCQATRHRIKVTWEHPSYVKDIKEYTVRWGELREEIIDPKMAKTLKLRKSYTSYMIDFTTDEMKYIGIQLHAETSRSKLKWQTKANSIQNITLKPLEPKPLSPSSAPMQNKKITNTLIVVIVVLFLAVSSSLILFITYRRRSNLKKKFKRIEIEMENKQKRGVVDKWEISYAILTIGEKIGEGNFGNVYCGFVKTIELRKTPYAEQCSGIKSKKRKVAVKFLKDDTIETECKDFYEEIKLMKDIGFHQNIVNMIGCGTITRPPYLVLEYMNGGDLLHYMRDFRKNKGCTGISLSKAAVAGTEDDSTENVSHLSLRDVMSFFWQIACGMEYLSINNVVHRDLAARNILISDDKNIKISDFGLSRFVSDELIYFNHNKSRKLPIKWMSIEAIYNQEFTTASDVWAYGVVLFEIVTLGGTPYPFIGNRELCKILKSGYRMEKPDNCDDTVYNIMLHCWKEIPVERPTFTELRGQLEELIEKEELYFSFDINENDSYYNVASFKSIPSDANDDADDALSNSSRDSLM